MTRILARPSNEIGGRETALPAMPGAGPPGIEASQLGWQYLRRFRPAFHDLTFALPPGHVLLVLGPSGCGKSTFARALVGLVPHVLPGTWQGELRIGDLAVTQTPARVLGERVGLVFQDPDSQLVMARVEDEVAFGLENRGWPRGEMTAAIPRALEAVGLGGFEPRATATLSGGEKQRLAIADILAARPQLLVFDEPTANLDPPGMHQTIERLAALARERLHTIVLIEHRLEAALPIADEVLLLDGTGGQIDFAPVAEVRRASVERLASTGAWVPSAWALGGVSTRERTAGEPGHPGRPIGAGPAALEARAVSVEYPAGAANAVRRAVDGVDLSIHSGERVALVGANGSGKSSLLLALAGILRPSDGTVRVAGRDPARLDPRELPTVVGMVFQDPELGFVARTVRAEAEATARALARPAGGSPEVLDAFGLAELAEVEPFRLSQGEQRRLSLAAYALVPPGMLLLDEPTFGLDRQGTEAVFRLLDRLRSDGQAQLLATHDPRILPWCDRVVALDGGRLVFEGRPEAFLAAPPYPLPEPWRAGT